VRIPGGFDAVFRQLTPLVLLGVVAVVLFEPWLPGLPWLRATFGEQVVLRACVAALGLYVLLLWGESIRLHTILTGVLHAFREHQGPAGGESARNPRLEAARLLIAALQSDDPQIRRTSHHNLVRLAGEDRGQEPTAWRQWLAEQERK